MHWTTLISAEELASAIDRCIVVDCRHDLADPSAGERAYAEGHIPSAFFLHLDRDLSGPKRVGAGRHPLPDREWFRCRLEALGLSDRTQLVVYDAQGGAMAVRVWALARWLGHEAVAVLDGDLRAWSAAGYPVTADPPAAPARRGRLDPGRPHLLAMVDADAIVGDLNAPAASRSMTIVDARAPERFSRRRRAHRSDRRPHPGRDQPAVRGQSPPGWPLQAGGRAARRVRCCLSRRTRPVARRSGRRRHGASVRVWRHRLPQSARDGTRRTGRKPSLPRLLERLDHRSVTADRPGRLSVRRRPGAPLRAGSAARVRHWRARASPSRPR